MNLHVRYGLANQALLDRLSFPCLDRAIGHMDSSLSNAIHVYQLRFRVIMPPKPRSKFAVLQRLPAKDNQAQRQRKRYGILFHVHQQEKCRRGLIEYTDLLRRKKSVKILW